MGVKPVQNQTAKKCETSSKSLKFMNKFMTSGEHI